MWRCQALTKMEKLPAGDPGRRVTVTKIPARSAVTAPTLASTPKSHEGADLKPLPLEKSILRTDFYQTSDYITISLFTKGVDLKKLHVDFGDDKVRYTWCCWSLPHIYWPTDTYRTATSRRRRVPGGRITLDAAPRKLYQPPRVPVLRHTEQGRTSVTEEGPRCEMGEMGRRAYHTPPLVGRRLCANSFCLSSRLGGGVLDQQGGRG